MEWSTEDMNYQNEIEFKKLVGRVAQLYPLRRILEIGSLHGETLRHWIEICEPGSTIVSIDMIVPPQDPRHRQQKDGHQYLWPRMAEKNQVNLFVLDDDSTNGHTIGVVKDLLPVIDFLFIDGGHDYRTCKLDWENYSPLVRKGGIVAFHDLGMEWPEVRQVWNPLKATHESEEFVEAVERFGIGMLYK